MHRIHLASSRRGAIVGVLAVVVACGAASGNARGAASSVCPSSTAAPYTMTANALTGSVRTDLTLTFTTAPGCGAVTTLKHLQVKTYTDAGVTGLVRNLNDVPAPGGVAQVVLDSLERGLRITTDASIQTGLPPRTYIVEASTRSLMRPDLVVTAVHAPLQTLTTTPVDVTADVAEIYGDTGATAQVTLAGDLGPLAGPVAVTVPAGGHVSVTFPNIALTAPAPATLKVIVAAVAPDEVDATNNTRSATVDVTKSQLATPYRVLFPSLVGYGAQFNGHLYASITAALMPPGEYADVETKVRELQPELVRIFYNDNWEENQDGTHATDWQGNYASFVNVVKLAQEAGATIDIGYQNLANLIRVKPPPLDIPAQMGRFADVLADLVINHGLTNVRWAEVANEPNSGAVTLDQYKAIAQALRDALVARGLGDQIQIMGGGLVENGVRSARDHYAWMTWIADNMNNLVGGYAEHVYWQYNDSGRLEYRLRDTYNLTSNVIPANEQKPVYMMEYGIRGDATCGTKPKFTNMYYGADPTNCPEIWRTNIAAFQQFWFDIGAAQLGMAGTSKWDAYWAVYDRTSQNAQVHWMTGPASEDYPLTPTYNALSLLFHATAPGWQIIGVDPWDSSDWSVPVFARTSATRSNDQPEQELAAYAGPSGELTIVGLDTHGKSLNVASTDPPSSYSIGGLPPNTTFTLAEWNATGDGTNSIAGLVTTNAAGVARFDVPLQAAFALTTVPAS